MVYILRFDGCCKPNPGDIGIGVIVLDEDNKKIIQISEKGGFGTNNQAEYKAIIRGFEDLLKTYSGDLLVQGDSQLVINQLKEEWKVKKQALIPLFNRVKELEEKFDKVDYKWISRNENKEADLLSAKALGLNLKKRDDKRVHLQVGSSYEFIFDDDEKIVIVKDNKYNRDVKKYYVISASKDGKNITGTYFETGAKKLIELLKFYAPLKNRKFRIIPTKAQNWTDYMVEEIKD
jgi:ribonuclease HI